jgi:hypothetical protein
MKPSLRLSSGTSPNPARMFFAIDPETGFPSSRTFAAGPFNSAVDTFDQLRPSGTDETADAEHFPPYALKLTSFSRFPRHRFFNLQAMSAVASPAPAAGILFDFMSDHHLCDGHGVDLALV